mmetsp:Transcript_16543/g.40744  ORF Transcript_16543/g.40744 Transcript_16543/m.40744 type:complete len:211 (-) Transcript_16543:1045-1677(-)
MESDLARILGMEESDVGRILGMEESKLSQTFFSRVRVWKPPAHLRKVLEIVHLSFIEAAEDAKSSQLARSSPSIGVDAKRTRAIYVDRNVLDLIKDYIGRPFVWDPVGWDAVFASMESNLDPYILQRYRERHITSERRLSYLQSEVKLRRSSTFSTHDACNKIIKFVNEQGEIDPIMDKKNKYQRNHPHPSLKPQHHHDEKKKTDCCCCF